MKKRIRKKLHLKEFRQKGNIIIINTNGDVESAEFILKMFEDIIDKFSLTVAGGGYGRLLIPSRKSNKYIPDLAGTVVTTVVDESFPIDQMMFCIYVKGWPEVPQEALDAIKDTFAQEKYNLQIGKSIDLWHTNFS